jgi:hypothetical protein
MESEPLACVLDRAPIDPFDDRLDAPTRVPRRAAQAAGKEHVTRTRGASDRLEPLQLQFELARGTIRSPNEEQPDERQPELARVWNGTIVDQHFGLVSA